MVDQNNLDQLERIIGVKFKNRELLLTAITHRSYLNEHRNELVGHNERLEFIGDAVLELVVTHHLYKAFPDVDEGRLTKFRSRLVCNRAHAKVGKALRLDTFVRLSHGERDHFSMGRGAGHIIGNMVEAIIGAIFLDRGYGVAELFVSQYILPRLEKMQDQSDLDLMDPKSKLQEIVQGNKRIIPTYRITKESGSDHDKQFVVAVYVGPEKVGEGSGPNKNAARQAAAKNALQSLYGIHTEAEEDWIRRMQAK